MEKFKTVFGNGIQFHQIWGNLTPLLETVSNFPAVGGIGYRFQKWYRISPHVASHVVPATSREEKSKFSIISFIFKHVIFFIRIFFRGSHKVAKKMANKCLWWKKSNTLFLNKNKPQNAPKNQNKIRRIPV